jgi:hypothetical protein
MGRGNESFQPTDRAALLTVAASDPRAIPTRTGTEGLATEIWVGNRLATAICERLQRPRAELGEAANAETRISESQRRILERYRWAARHTRR